MSTILSMAVFAISAFAAIYIALHPRRKKNTFNPFYLFFIGVFAAEIILFFPFCYDRFNSQISAIPSAFLASIHTSLKLFIVDCDFDLIITYSTNVSDALRGSFILWGLILFVLSPILTAGAVLSFLANVSAHTKYFSGFLKDTYIFSELNEYSIALASSLKKNNPSRMIVFTDVYEKSEEQSSEMIKEAKKLDAVIFKNDITTINFRAHSKKRKLYFFIVGKDDDENLNQTAILTAPYNKKHKKTSKKDFSKFSHGYDYERGDTRLYLFTTSFASELQVKALKPRYIKVRRIIERQSLIYKLLNDHGIEIFNSAKETGNTVFNSATKQNDPEKKISAIIVGLGSYGTEMLRAMSWFGQMHPYRLEITAFDANAEAADIFRSSYPELFDYDPTNPNESPIQEDGTRCHNGDFETPGESHYKITIHSGVNANSHAFDQAVSAITDASYIFVSLGDDNKNIKTATKLRTLFRREKIADPVIHTIVYNQTNQIMLEDDYNRGKDNPKSSLCILPFGAISSNYSEECILNSDIEQLALSRHMEYTHKVIAEKGYEGEEKEQHLREGEESFWGVDYNYRSSIASAIHTKYKRALNIPGANKAKPADRTDDERDFYANMEHQRWNAYVRSEGYVWTKTIDKKDRDNLIKTHHLLVPFEKLPEYEKIKDDD